MLGASIDQPESKRKATNQGLMSAAIPPRSSAREHQPGGKHDETIDAVLHNDSTAVRVTIGRRGVKSTPTSPSKADAGPPSARTRNWRAANDLRQAARTLLAPHHSNSARPLAERHTKREWATRTFCVRTARSKLLSRGLPYRNPVLAGGVGGWGGFAGAAGASLPFSFAVSMGASRSCFNIPLPDTSCAASTV